MSQQETKDMAKYFYRASAADFMKIPGGPVAYWVSGSFRDCFENLSLIGDKASAVCGMTTGENARFVREWFEIDFQLFGRGLESEEAAEKSQLKWFPYAKGGSFRKWYGNAESVIDWQNNGERVISSGRAYPRARSKYFLPSVSWSFVSSSHFGARQQPQGFIFDMAGCSLFPLNSDELPFYTALLCAKTASVFLKTINPTLNYQVNNVGAIPVPEKIDFDVICVNSAKCVGIAKKDWDSHETSWDFETLPLVQAGANLSSISESYKDLRISWSTIVAEMKDLEEENNSLFIEAYGLQDELSPIVETEAVTLFCNPAYEYGGHKAPTELEALLQGETLEQLISYAIGCMMGRYSLDKPGLILASQGETHQDYLRNIPSPRFAPDDDAILPLTDQEWFADDATNRFREFVRVVWGDEHLQENLDFVAESLCLHAIKPKRGESALDTIRRYLSTQFYKDHLRTYKKRPIYWLFSSGKHKAFECLVYLHRYNEGTLARMRTEYVIPLSAKLNAYAEKLEHDKEVSTSAAETKRLEKEIATLHKQQAELAEFDEKLRHFADQRISLDLDDGVKVNYGKFGDLLAEVKAVTGEKPQ